jgi:hypothetical protein
MNHMETLRISAARIVVKKPTQVSTSDPCFERPKGLHAACAAGTNKNDAAIALITACLDEGINIRLRIIETLN